MSKTIKCVVVALAITAIAAAAVADGSGRYLKHAYTYNSKNGVISASFKPFLPRDDKILIGAMLELVIKVYGKNQITDLQPQVVNSKGRNLIRFRGIDHDYLFLIFKQDTGEVHSLSMWRNLRKNK